MTSGEHFLEAELQHQLSEHESNQALTEAVREAEKAKSKQQQSMSGNMTQQHTHPIGMSSTTPPNELLSQICSMGFQEDEVGN